jgi:hypothetical protein
MSQRSRDSGEETDLNGPPNYDNKNVKVVQSEYGPDGDAVHVVRPYAQVGQTSDNIARQLASQYDYKRNQLNAGQSDLNTFQKAFPKIATALVNSYDGSTIQSDTNQDLIGDKYLTEQIRKINSDNKNKSILDKWSHLLYEGEDEATYTSATDASISDMRGLKPINSNQSRTTSMASTSHNNNNNNNNNNNRRGPSGFF